MRKVLKDVLKARKQALGVLTGFPFLKHRAESRALAAASSPLPQESSDTSSSRAGGSRSGLWNCWVVVRRVAQEGQMGQTPFPFPNQHLTGTGTVLELGNAGSQLTKTSAIAAPASIRNECGPEFTIFIFN